MFEAPQKEIFSARNLQEAYRTVNTGGFIPTVSYNGLYRHFTWNGEYMELEQNPVKKDTLEMANMRVFKAPFLVFISTPLIKTLKIICSKLYFQENYTFTSPTSTVPLSIAIYSLFNSLIF